MLERFCAAFELTGGSVRSGEGVALGTVAEVVRARLGGATFGHGVYRVHTGSSAAVAAEFTQAAFPEFAGRLDYFGFDRLRRQFAADTQRGSSSDPEVMMLEPGTGEALEIPVPLSRFHDEELVDYAEAALAGEFHSEWMAIRTVALGFDQCAGYRVPLFLGGDDAVANLEQSDIGVYWSLMGRLRLKAQGLQPGLPISAIELE